MHPINLGHELENTDLFRRLIVVKFENIVIMVKLNHLNLNKSDKTLWKEVWHEKSGNKCINIRLKIIGKKSQNMKYLVIVIF